MQKVTSSFKSYFQTDDTIGLEILDNEDISISSEKSLPNDMQDIIQVNSTMSTNLSRSISLHTIEEFTNYENVNPIVKQVFSSSMDIENLSDVDFKIIYKNYEHNKKLDNSERIQLSKIIIKTILQKQLDIQ